MTVDDWLQAGYAVLAAEGFRALKIDNVCRRLGMTKGSFYHHFADVNAFHEALVTSWAGWRDAEHRQMESLSSEEPRTRLRKMIDALVGPPLWTLERAMREWARSDPRAEASVRAADRQTRQMIRQAFAEYGFDDETAARRAEWMFAMGIGALHLSATPRSGPEWDAERDKLIEFLLRP